MPNFQSGANPLLNLLSVCHLLEVHAGEVPIPTKVLRGHHVHRVLVEELILDLLVVHDDARSRYRV